MTVHAERDERIRLLREAMERIANTPRTRNGGPSGARIAAAALLADDALAATPPPDLPLAEGSEWGESYDGVVGVRDCGASLVMLVSTNRGLAVACDDDLPYLADVLALARREGLV